MDILTFIGNTELIDIVVSSLIFLSTVIIPIIILLVANIKKLDCVPLRLDKINNSHTKNLTLGDE
jgi:hypothetical protein